MQCNFQHEQIKVLFGVPKTPKKELPTVCTCGAQITYADDLLFVDLPKCSYDPLDDFISEEDFPFHYANILPDPNES